MYIITVSKKGTTHPVINLLLSQFDFISKAIQRSLMVSKVFVCGGYSIFFIFLLLNCMCLWRIKLNIYPGSTIPGCRVYVLLEFGQARWYLLHSLPASAIRQCTHQGLYLVLHPQNSVNQSGVRTSLAWRDSESMCGSVVALYLGLDYLGS